MWLLTMPGVPSLYYGSEWGIGGMKAPGDDGPLRPPLRLPEAATRAPHPNLAGAIARFAALRHAQPALRQGSYQQLHVDHRRLAFARRLDQQELIIVVSAVEEATLLELPARAPEGSRLVDLLEPGMHFAVRGQRVCVDPVPANWVRILALPGR